MKQIKILWLILISFFCLSFQAASAPVSKTYVCASILDEIRPFHSIRGVSKANTQDALDVISDFRNYTLLRSDASPSLRQVSAQSSNASESLIKAVAQRLRGIEIHIRDEKSKEPDSAQEDGALKVADSLHLGTVFRGEQASAFLNETDETLSEVNGSNKAGLIFSAMPATFSVLGAVGIWIQSHRFIDALLTRQRFDVWALEVVCIDVLCVGPDNMYYFLSNQSWAYHQASQNLKEAFNSTDKNAWAISSLKLRFRPRTLRKVFNRRSSGFDGATFEAISALNEHIFQTRSHLLDRMMNKIVRRGDDLYKNGVVQIDRLVSHDRETGEPMVTVFFRAYVEKPKFITPSRKKLSEKIRDSLQMPQWAAPGLSHLQE